MDETNCYCIFKIDDQLFGIPVDGVEKIIRAAAVTPVPDAPDTLIGLINVEGRILPVVNIRKKWHLPELPIQVDDRIILFKTDRTICFVVNGVEGVVQYERLGYHQADDIQPGLKKYIEGVGTLDDKNVIIVNLSRFFNSQEREYLEQITADHG